LSNGMHATRWNIPRHWRNPSSSCDKYVSPADLCTASRLPSPGDDCLLRSVFYLSVRRRKSLTYAGSCGQLLFIGDLWRTFVPGSGCEPCSLPNPSELDQHLAANLRHASVRDWVFEDGSGLSCSAWGPKIWHSMVGLGRSWRHALHVPTDRSERTVTAFHN
jgi:hypothetical protein